MTRVLHLFVAVLFLSVQGQELCDYGDSDCLTKAAKRVYKSLVAGVKDVIEPIEPLYLKKIKCDQEKFKCLLSNVFVSGWSKCDVTLCKCDKEKWTYEYQLECPQLVFDFFYKVNGALGANELDGKGYSSVTIDDYVIVLKGNYNESVFPTDHLPHISVDVQNVETNLKGKLKYDSKYQIHGEKAKSDLIKAYLNEKYKETEKLLESHVLVKFVDLFIETVNKYYGYFPAAKVISRD